ncbi:MAG: YbhB/YbcL family Raf kinase inhibitor-like protein [Proteobacteria bacterium]|nr:YbhB/YbcL family Raf kinase inhibitor-like protein [Desulfocapsa sp.]MBU3944042.1 YbhB/YbcL family Raf kinase inhibitor-like protein [Pseudomonadota bacterium]MBU4029511.1 YbhB/YbcL family Raf kinase inhibitor-like protein [Pseudomonadota bacterium]MBU4043287.1 YbhB/YbcL family Raf kinase inhibitor-like protein [Pseudomonadota bacterium]MBU4107869.1 YbhB/YbcL family Raf kinase inhibitor-like protein [Pseudomonadota bacterium]
MSLSISSPAFVDNSQIPVIYTCDGRNISPPLEWTGIPANTKSLVLFIDDPDAPDPAAPRMTWVHWLLYNIPVTTSGLAEGIAPNALPKGTLSGRGDNKKTTYGGPCPPIGCHRYFHKLYALDIILPELHQPTKNLLLETMEGHILAHAEIIGLYQRPSK